MTPLVSNISIRPSGGDSRKIARSATRGELKVRDGQAPVFFQSVHEQNFLIICRCDRNVLRVRWEPFTLSYYDHHEDRKASYTPDYLVDFENANGVKQMLVEVKTLRDYNRSRAAFAAKYCAAEDWAALQPSTTFKIATDRWMKDVGLENFKLLDSVRDRSLNTDHMELVRKEIFNNKGLTLESIFERAIRCGVPKGLVMPVVLKLAQQGKVGFDVRQPLTMETTFDDRPLTQAFRQ